MTGRHYTVDGQRLPSVTTILTALANDGITAWKLRVGLAEAERVSRDATDFGTALHSIFERVNRDQLDLLSAQDTRDIQAYIDWKTEHVSVVLGAEKFLVSRKHGMAGTADLIAVMKDDGMPAVLDLKSSRTPLGILEWRLQLGAYSLMAQEEGIDARRRIILRMPRAEAGKLYVHELDENHLEVDQRAFLAVLRIYNWRAEAEAREKKPVGPRIKFSSREK